MFLLSDILRLGVEVSSGNSHHLHTALESFPLSPGSSCQLEQTLYHHIYIVCIYFCVHDYPTFFEKFYRQFIYFAFLPYIWSACGDLDRPLQMV